jgi:hypothetical protein
VVSTIENHLLRLIQKGELNAGTYLDNKKEAIITSALAEEPEISIGALKNKLGDRYSFFELRLGMYLFQQKEAKEN